MNKLLSKIIDRKETMISVQLCGKCNLRCKMCGHSKLNGGFISDQVFDSLIEKCHVSNIKELRFSSSWGEATLNPKWKERIVRCVNEN